MQRFMVGVQPRVVVTMFVPVRVPVRMLDMRRLQSHPPRVIHAEHQTLA